MPVATYRIIGSPLVSSMADGSMVILETDRGIYYTLNDTGAEVWKALATGPKSVEELGDAVAAEFAVLPAECRDDVAALLDDLVRNRLVELASAVSW